MNFLPITFFLLCFAFLAGGFNMEVQGQDTSLRVKDTITKKKDSSGKSIGVASNNLEKISKTLTKDTSKVEDRNNKTTAPPQVKSGSVAPTSGSNTITAATDSTGANSNVKNSSQIIPLPETAWSQDILANTNKTTDRVLAANKMINTSSKGTYFLQEIRTLPGKEFIFYLLCIIIFILGTFKTFYSMYFSNLFRIFFNTSLRQTQLTDQLSQAKLPSFILNIFFTISGGTYIWLLFTQFNRVQTIKSQTLLLICILSVASIYLIKFIILKFIGWLAGIQNTVNNYIFVIFLVNKITGVLLIPFLVLLSFSRKEWIPSVAVISALFIGLLFLSRYAKSYSALENKLSVNSLHLLIFVVGAEVIPIFVFYKIAVDYLI